MKTDSSLDAITRDVIDGALRHLVHEMRTTLIKLSYTPHLYETHDLACAICNPEGEVVAMHVELPMHIFPATFGIKELMASRADSIKEGDIYLINDPWLAGTHLNDILLLQPIFVEGKIVQFATVRAHFGDVGGMAPGSISGDATEIFQEGTRIPLVRLRRDGVVNDELLNVLLANTRQPYEMEGIIFAQLAVCQLANERIQQLYAEYGPSNVASSIQWTMELARAQIARAVAELPDGEYYYEDYLENSGTKPGNLDPIYVRSKMAIDGENISFDFRDVPAQRPGVCNAQLPITWCGAFTVLQTLLGEGDVASTAAVRQLEVEATPGSVLASQYPVAMSGFCDLLFGPIQGSCVALLSQVMPEKVCAPVGSSADQVALSSGVADQPWFVFEFSWGGWPAVKEHDGNINSSQWDNGDIPCFWPIERMETLTSIRVVVNDLHPDSGGPGFRRGGIGTQRAWQLLSPAHLSLVGSDAIIPRPGMSMGYGGMLNRLEVYRDNEKLKVTDIPFKASGVPLQAGDIVIMSVSGGGGYGDPLDRPSELVLQDVLDGYVSIEGARADYGVVLDGAAEDMSVNDAATADLRATQRSERCYPQVKAGSEDEYDNAGRRIVRLAPVAAAGIGVDDGDLVELVPSARTPLRAWVRIDSDAGESSVALGPIGLKICGIEAGERLWLRRPWSYGSSEASIAETAARVLDSALPAGV